MEEIRKKTVSRIAEFFNGESTNAEVDTYKKLLDFEKEVKKQLTLTDVVSSAKTCDCGSGQTNFHKKIGCRECC